MNRRRIVAIAASAALLSPLSPASAHGACEVTTDGYTVVDYVNGFIACAYPHEHYDLDICVQMATLTQYLSGTYSTPVCRPFSYDSTVARSSWSGGYFWSPPPCGTTDVVRYFRSKVTGRAGTTHPAQTVYSPGFFRVC